MKTVKLLFLFIILFAQTMFAHSTRFKSDEKKSKYKSVLNYVQFTPLSQTVSTNSDTEVSVTVFAQCYGNSSEMVSISPTYIKWDGGLKSISYSNGAAGWLTPGQNSTITFKFKKTVTSNSSFEYQFSSNGSIIDIKVNYNYVASPSCSLPFPPNFHTDVQATSIKYNWDAVSGASSYIIGYTNNWPNWTNVNVSNAQTSAIVYGLTPNTEYMIFVVAVCANGVRGNTGYGNSSITGSSAKVTTLPTCPNDLTIPTAVITGSDNKQAANTIIASNTLNSGANGIYHAGTSVTLSPGFNAKSGSTFRAYIAGCTNTYIQKKEYSKEEVVILNEEFIISEDKETYFKLYPNPTTGIFKIAFNAKSEGTIIIIDMFGKPVYTKEFKDENELEIDIQNQISGIYTVTVYNGEQQFIQKIIKQ